MDVRLPKLGEGVDSGSVVTLFVKEGDVITEGQTILELENEKAVAPIPSPAAGKVSNVRVKAGDKLGVGQVILTLGGAGEAAAAPAAVPQPAAAEPSEKPEPKEDGYADPGLNLEDLAPSTSASKKAGFPPPAAPSLRRLAKDLGIDLSKIRGSQNGGRIVLADVRNYIQRLQQVAFAKAKEQSRVAASEAIDFSKWGPISAKAMSPLRQVISRRMTESWTAIPHVTQFDDADLTRVTDLRKRLAKAYEAQGGRLTVTAFILKALAIVLRKHPIFNASLDESGSKIVFKEYIHIGLAVDTEAGLLVPVIRDVDTKTMLQLSKEIEDLAAKGRDRKLAPEDMRGGTFTVSNQGGIGSAHFTPIINRPEVAILGVGRAAMQPAVREDKVVPRLLLPLALSYDHRLIDGGNAARFMVDLIAALENFAEADAKV